MKRIEVFYHDQKVGELAEAGRQTSFQFSPTFIQGGIQLAPLTMPLRSEPVIYSDPEFDYLPPLMDDSLPDRYGRSVMNRWFAQKFGDQYRPSVLEKLAYVGEGGIGALTYRPVLEMLPSELLREMDLRQEQKLATSFIGQHPSDLLEKLRRAVHTVGGRFPKALVAMDETTGLHYEDDPRLDSRFSRWIVKFGIPFEERDNLLNYPEIEYAYSRMARTVGIDMTRTQLLRTHGETGNLTHFAIERFDIAHGSRLHTASLSALTSIPAGRLELDYRDLLSTTFELCRDLRQVRQAFLRMVFNVVMHNVDDHGKNHGFLFDGKEWRLSPAFDLTFSDVSAPGTHTVASRAMPVAGNPINPKRKDFLKLGERFGLKREDCNSLVDQVGETARQLAGYLEEAGVIAAHASTVVASVDRALSESFV